MTWAHRWGEQLENGFYYHLLAKGSIQPKDMEPDIGAFAFYVEAFRELSTCRSGGMGLGPIPFTAVVEYTKLHHMEYEEFEEFLYFIREMDRCFLNLEAEKSKAGGMNAGKTGTGNHR